jgi:phage tail tape-measure protein
VGDRVGAAVGVDVGAALGVLVGDRVGAAVGVDVGAALGVVGDRVGAAVGVDVGAALGARVGDGVHSQPEWSARTVQTSVDLQKTQSSLPLQSRQRPPPAFENLLPSHNL